MMSHKKITLREFLYKYTAISKTFIDGYCVFYDMCNLQNKFGIEISAVMDYLQITKREMFMKRFVQNYKEGTHYIVENIPSKSTKGVKMIFYYLTFETFQKICMLSHSEKANSVRDYFVTIQKFILDFKDTINDALEKDLKAQLNGVIYVLLLNKKKDLYKVGIVKDEKLFKNRLKSYMTGKEKHVDIKLIMRIHDPLQVEQCVSKLLKDYKMKEKEQQEIFKVSVETIRQTINSCLCMDNSDLNNNELEGYVIFSDD
jgi:phage anti-repressor protein